MQLQCHLAYPEFTGCLFVEEATDDKWQHLVLACGQLRHAARAGLQHQVRDLRAEIVAAGADRADRLLGRCVRRSAADR